MNKFNCRIYNISCTNLEAKDRNGKSDPFVKFDFDNFKKFQTPVIHENLNPIYDFELHWLYQTKYAHTMQKKSFFMFVYDHDRFGQDDFIGKTFVDLRTLATGGQHYDLQLRNEGRPVGRIKFTFEMAEQSTLTTNITDAKISNLPLIKGKEPSTYLSVGYNEDLKTSEEPAFTTATEAKTRNPHWRALTTHKKILNLRQLYTGGFEIKIFNKPGWSAEHIGTVHISPFKYHDFEERYPLEVKENVIMKEGYASDHPDGVVFTCSLTYRSFPTYVQMERGIYIYLSQYPYAINYYIYI